VTRTIFADDVADLLCHVTYRHGERGKARDHHRRRRRQASSPRTPSPSPPRDEEDGGGRDGVAAPSHQHFAARGGRGGSSGSAGQQRPARAAARRWVRDLCQEQREDNSWEDMWQWQERRVWWGNVVRLDVQVLLPDPEPDAVGVTLAPPKGLIECSSCFDYLPRRRQAVRGGRYVRRVRERREIIGGCWCRIPIYVCSTCPGAPVFVSYDMGLEGDCQEASTSADDGDDDGGDSSSEEEEPKLASRSAAPPPPPPHCGGPSWAEVLDEEEPCWETRLDHEVLDDEELCWVGGTA